MTREEHYAKGEEMLQQAEDARYNPSRQTALGVCAQAHFLAALAAPLVLRPVTDRDNETILKWGS